MCTGDFGLRGGGASKESKMDDVICPAEAEGAAACAEVFGLPGGTVSKELKMDDDICPVATEELL